MFRHLWSTLAPLVLAGAIAVHPAGAETPIECAPGSMVKFAMSPLREHLRFKGEFTVPPGFDPLIDGLTFTVSYEPETDPANSIYTVTLPAGGFHPGRNGSAYLDHTALIGGIKLVRVNSFGSDPNRWRIRVNRRGPTIPGVSHPGKLRMVLESGGSCVRTCSSDCAGDETFSCRKSVDEPLCGLISGVLP